MSRQFATLDRNRMGPSLTLDESEMQVTCVDAADGQRSIFGTLAGMSGEYAFEAVFWSESQATQEFAIGVTEPDGSVSARAGDTAESIALWPAEGKIRANSTDVATIPTTGERVTLGVRLILSPSSAVVEFYVGGSLVHSESLATGKAWLPAVSLGADRAGAVFARANFGATLFDSLPWRNGWGIARPGIAAVRLAITGHGWMSDGTGMPSHEPFVPYIIAPDKVVIRRKAAPWWMRSGKAASGAACTIQLDNSDGTFDSLRDADARDAAVTLYRAQAMTAESDEVPDVLFTGVVERISEPRDGVVEIVLRDTLARIDKPIPMRYTPPYSDALYTPIPIALGAQRTVQPLLVDGPNRVYLLGDAPMTNVTLVTDMGAPLDPNALPPQYVPALGQTGIALATDAVGRIGVDCSTVGQQYEIPGADDVLDGDGEFGTWGVTVNTYTDTPPSGWTWSGDASGATSALMKRVVSSTTIARIVSDLRWSQVGSATYGEQLATSGTPLLAGRSYRITITVGVVIIRTDTTDDKMGGIRLVSALDFTAASAISSQQYAIREPGTYTFDYRVPTGSNRALYIVSAASMSTAGATIGQCLAEVSDVRVELLGQFMALPLAGISADDAFREVLVNRMGEDPAVYSAADCIALPQYSVGFRFGSTNALDALSQIADEFGAVVFTDKEGAIRVKRLSFDSTPVATFGEDVIVAGSLRIAPDQPASLTTRFGGRPNVDPFSSGDFVTDTAVVPPARRAVLMDESQILYTSSVPLAAEYDYALLAPRRRTRIDDADQLAAEATRVLADYADRRQIITATILYDREIAAAVLPEDLLIGDVVTLNAPSRGIYGRNCVVLGTAHAPAAKTLEVTLWA